MNSDEEDWSFCYVFCIINFLFGLYVFKWTQWTAGKDQGSRSSTTAGPAPPGSSLRTWSRPSTSTLSSRLSKHGGKLSKCVWFLWTSSRYVLLKIPVASPWRFPPQVPSDPVHRGALLSGSAASDGSHLQGRVWRQTPDGARGADGRAAAFTHSAEGKDHTQGGLTSLFFFFFLERCWYCCHVVLQRLGPVGSPLCSSRSTRSSPWREEESAETSGRVKSRETWRSGILWIMYLAINFF